MRFTKSKLLLGAAVTSACALAVVVVLKRPSAPRPAQPAAPVESVAAAHSSQEAAAPPAVAAAPGPAAPETPAVPPEPAAAPAKPVPPAPASGKGAAPQDALAREALSLVGADPRAEAYWIEAINDSRLSADERQNLIEDLNEDGLSDPKHPTAEDLPVILSRLALIEHLAPDAMDEVNLNAFAEAYTDLLNLAAVALGGGQRVN